MRSLRFPLGEEAAFLLTFERIPDFRFHEISTFDPLGELAQLARASAWHVEGRRFDSDILHFKKSHPQNLRIGGCFALRLFNDSLSHWRMSIFIA